jgi:UDP-2,3-diacylglucosamine hydrolase
MKAIFLSDAHLRSAADDNYQDLLNLLKQQHDLDALFLLGDIFEFWLGYEHLVFSAYIPLLEQLRRLKEGGTRLFFVEGNHDFTIGPYFRDTLECTVITEQALIHWDNRNILICHGDLIHPSPAYLRLRKLWRSPLIKFLVRLIHPDLVWKFGIWLSDKGQQKRSDHQQQDPTPWLQEFSTNAVTQPCDLMICGHFHVPVYFQQHGREVIALGDWQTHRSYAQLIDGNISILSYPD